MINSWKIQGNFFLVDKKIYLHCFILTEHSGILWRYKTVDTIGSYVFSLFIGGIFVLSFWHPY